MIAERQTAGQNRPEFYRFHQGEKVLPFAPAEYDARLAGFVDVDR